MKDHKLMFSYLFNKILECMDMLSGSSKRHKKQLKEENMRITPSVYGRGMFF